MLILERRANVVIVEYLALMLVMRNLSPPPVYNVIFAFNSIIDRSATIGEAPFSVHGFGRQRSPREASACGTRVRGPGRPAPGDRAVRGPGAVRRRPARGRGPAAD